MKLPDERWLDAAVIVIALAGVATAFAIAVSAVS